MPNAVRVVDRVRDQSDFAGALSDGQFLKYDLGTDTFRLAAAGGASGANPTASVGLAAVNGSASTFLRSDAAPALSQAIAPTWTGKHVHSLADAAALAVGPNGDTNPTLRVVTNVASAATGLAVTGNAAGAGATLTVLSTGTDEDAVVVPKGAGALRTPLLCLYSNHNVGAINSDPNNFGMLLCGSAPSNPEVWVTGGGVRLRGDVALKWSGSSSTAVAGPDVGLERPAAASLRVTDGSSGLGSLTCSDLYTSDAAFLVRTKTTLTGGGTGSAPTLTAGPQAGNPTKWLPVDDNGTTRYVPAW